MSNDKRREEFPPNGERIRVNPGEVIQAWRRATSFIPAEYAVGTAQHESDFTVNEIDHEPPTPKHPEGFCSMGIFQVDDEECEHVGRRGINLLTLENSVAVFSALSTRRLGTIIQAARLTHGPAPLECLAYLSIAHNQGLAAALRTINAHGLDWKGYKQRNEELAVNALYHAETDEARAKAREHLRWFRKVFAYGDDCMTGGPRWPQPFTAKTSDGDPGKGI